MPTELPPLFQSQSQSLCRGFEASLADERTETGDLRTERWARALVEDACDARASDIHLDSQIGGVRVRFRIDGAVREIAMLPKRTGNLLIGYFKVTSNLDPAPSLRPEDSHLQWLVHGETLDIRLACAPCLYGDKLALRLLRRAAVKHRLGALGLRNEDHTKIHSWLGDISGMFLVAGPVSSGKTTTLYALLAELHMNERNIVTIEDPVEYQLENINQMEVNLRRGVTFELGLKSILRLDPDYILLGEIRDKESALIAMEAASTGRVVMTTMHSRNVAGVITALRSLGISNYEIAASLAFVVGQRLVRTLCRGCRILEAPSETERDWLISLGEKVPGEIWHAGKCAQCGGTGYFGRTGVFEVLPVAEHVYDMIISGEDEHTLRKHLKDVGFHPLLRDGLEKAAEGITDLSELMHLGAQGYLEQSR